MTKEENEKRLTRLKNIVSSLPNNPGTYQYYDKDDHIIYVGKAKNLKKRVSSYFHKETDRFKTKVLVSKIYNITYTVVKSEEDALLIENQLIKQYQPKYNVLLKDGKTYPSICISKEYFPRIFSTRIINKQTGTYFGPYSNVKSMHNVLKLIKKIYKPRTCLMPMTKKGIELKKYKSCLEFHIGNCDAPCIAKISHNEYLQNIRQIHLLLKGQTRQLQQLFKSKMNKAAANLEFEKAEQYKQKYLALENFAARNEIVSYTITDVDVFSIINDENRKKAFINYIHVKNGAINQSFTFEYKRKLEETDEELLNEAIIEIRDRFKSKAREIIVPFQLDYKIKDADFFIPQRGDKKHLLELSKLNAKQHKFDKLKQSEKLNPEQKGVRLMKELQEKLKLKKLPYHIECFDNSNISGADAVAGCIVYKGMKPSKKDYRLYNIKTVVGPDDYASMKEVVFRRYKRMIDENSSLPDLIITDGGKGQMEVVRQIVEDVLKLSIPIAGLVKNSHHRTNELLFGFPPLTITISTKSELFKVLTQIQDEVHRFAISFHRKKRSKHQIHSELDDIKGIGTSSKNKLIKHFKTIPPIKSSTIEEITEVIGAAKAKLLFNYFHKKEEETK